MFCVRSYLNSILYNLLSNALKYGDPNRVNKISISSYLNDCELILVVQDNGIGIDLNKFGNNLFGMYKRFHEHVDGKGMGLFLTKQQVEAIGGRIEIKSTLGLGSKFILTFPNTKIECIDDQLYYESEAAIIWYDSAGLIATLMWKKRPASEEFREALSRTKDLFKAYRCIGCLYDVRELGRISEGNKKWFINNILVGAPDLGMQMFVVVHNPTDNKDNEYFKGMREAAESRGIVFNHSNYEIGDAKQLIRNI